MKLVDMRMIEIVHIDFHFVALFFSLAFFVFQIIQYMRLRTSISKCRHQSFPSLTARAPINVFVRNRAFGNPQYR